MKRITLKDIGEKAGVSTTTVSLALRNDSRLTKETIRRVKRFADQLGYMPDPWLSSLSSYRHTSKLATPNTTIAMVTNWEHRGEWKKFPSILNYYNGAMQMAEELGYKLEEFHLGENGGEARTASILFNRGIKGILLLPNPPEIRQMHFDFSRFSVVQVGRTLSWPSVNSVIHHHYNAVHFTIYTLRKRGYHRIGLAITEKEHQLHRRCWLASYLVKQYDFSDEMTQVPPYLVQEFEKKPFLSWLKKHRCDVVISNKTTPYHYMKEAGYQVPDDVGFSCLCLEERGDISGIFMKSEIAGAQAINLLHMLMMSRQLGCPKNPMNLVIEGEWHAGTTVIPQSVG